MVERKESVTEQNAFLVTKENGKSPKRLPNVAEFSVLLFQRCFAQASWVPVFRLDWPVGFLDLFWRGSLKEALQRHDPDL